MCSSLLPFHVRARMYARLRAYVAGNAWQTIPKRRYTASRGRGREGGGEGDLSRGEGGKRETTNDVTFASGARINDLPARLAIREFRALSRK